MATPFYLLGRHRGKDVALGSSGRHLQGESDSLTGSK